MSQLPEQRHRLRADAARSIASILDAAVDVLSRSPDASMDDIAKAAGVSRQTVYAHFSSREALLRAVQDRAVEETIAALDAAKLDEGSPLEALDRLVSTGWQTLDRYPLLVRLRVSMTLEEQHALHRPILDRLERLIRRGQRAGVFDRGLPPNWLLAAYISLSHAAADEVAAGRLTASSAARSLSRTIRRTFGVGD